MIPFWYASPILGVAHVRRTAEYYRDVLGFQLGPDGVFQPSDDEPEGVYAIVRRPGVALHLQIRRDAPPRRERPSFERDVYVYVDALDAVHAELVQRGAHVVSPPAMAPHGIREFVVEDPDGHRLAFGEIPRHVLAADGDDARRRTGGPPA